MFFTTRKWEVYARRVQWVGFACFTTADDIDVCIGWWQITLSRHWSSAPRRLPWLRLAARLLLVVVGMEIETVFDILP